MVAYIRPSVSSFGLSVVSNVFANRTHLGLPSFDFAFCSDKAGDLRTDLGLHIQVEHGPDVMVDADLIILLPSDLRPLTLSPVVIQAIKNAHRQGAIISAFCSGSFLLAETGLLDGRRAATHWNLAARLAQSYPTVTVDPEALYVDEDRIVTGAGTAAGIDMCLHLLHREHGAIVANAVAGEAMVAPRRQGGQVYYMPTPPFTDDVLTASRNDKRLADALTWMHSHLHQQLSVDDMARHALMSPRTFTRRFREATGTTPHAWLSDQRLDRVAELLVTTDLPIQKIAHEVGFRSDSVLREHFVKRHGMSPRSYRNAFK
ncbi:GlxA family transcriptional regulator [Streptosporangium sp. G11]|uniref:GlxA family transcriptional regulator n=1 Tax=Streptosporangium sp. G11 TaxID=3436926 RepID=UPI003EBB01BF